MAETVGHRLGHKCVLVRGIDQAIEHHTNMLGAVAFHLLDQKVAE